MTPAEPTWIQQALALVRDHPEMAALVCFVLGFAESIALVSLFVPSTILFLAIGAAASAAGGAFWPLWLAGAAGACIGDGCSYLVGRWLKDDVRRIWPFTRFPDLLPQSRSVFERWGALAIVGGKFIGGLRPFIPVAAGSMDMPWAAFLIASAGSSLLWAGVFLAPGFGAALAWR
jgi:membrane protein DedA with SNARE-associated domain